MEAVGVGVREGMILANEDVWVAGELDRARIVVWRRVVGVSGVLGIGIGGLI